jgi:2-oxoglutarate ferredoxin oxidoreductase subunit delta
MILARVIIDKEACKGCGLCEIVCPKKILVLSESELNKKGYNPIEVTDMSLCTACCSCAKMCPDYVFVIEK